ncbi:Os03g0328600, partial [Oryza sativa Japonica Group]
RRPPSSPHGTAAGQQRRPPPASAPAASLISARVRLHGQGPGAPVAGVPDGELQPVRPPGHGAHLLHHRRLHAGHQLNRAGAARHRVDVLDGLGGRQDRPRGQRRVVVLVHGRHQHA